MANGEGRVLWRFLLRHCLAGALAAAVFGTGLLAFDVMGLRALVLASEAPALPVFLLFFGLFVTFGALAMGAAVMSLGRDGS